MTGAIPSTMLFRFNLLVGKQIYLSNYLWLFPTDAGMISGFYKKVTATIIKARDFIVNLRELGL